MTAPPFSFQDWPAGIIAAAACAALIVVSTKRRPAVPRATLLLAAIGAMLIALASSGMTWMRPAARRITVLLDLSPSTRAAEFRYVDGLQRRVKQLVGDVPVEITCFAEQVGALPKMDHPHVPDLPGRRTVLPSVDAPAVLLFSDGRFAQTPSTLPPVYAVIDPALERAKDAAMTSLEAHGDTITIGVRNTGDTPRALELNGLTPGGIVSVQPGSYTLTRKLAPAAESISATLAPGDEWPENDSLRMIPPPPATAQRWWVSDGASAPDASWVSLMPGQLPADIAGYLGTSAIVLDDVPAGALDDARRAALDRYVRELGGGLLILGGGHAFAAGGYAGTVLDTLSPLASTPPEPTTHWVLLADASGSMNQDARWQYAADAVAGALKQLPPADLVSIGSFADDVRWWSHGKSASETLKLTLPPPDVRPHGATNLETALREIATMASESKLQTQLLIATDAQTTIDAAADIAARFKSRQVKLHLLLIGDPAQATALPALQSIIAATGGTARTERLPANWASGIRELLRAAEPSRLQQRGATVRFLDPLASLPSVRVRLWNRTWRKSDATPLAETELAGEGVVMAARWNAGAGQVAAIAFHAAQEIVEAAAKLIQRPPRDPRFRVAVETGSTLHVSVDAIDGNTYLNGERLTLQLAAAALSIPQTGPGRYELTTDARAGIARVRRGRETLDAFAVPERYAPEFDAVGNDRAALAELARRTGGRVVEPGDTRRLDLPLPRRPVPLASWLATAGAAFVCAGLVRWRIGS